VTDEKLGCAGLKNFDTSSSASVPSSWEDSWKSDGRCQLVPYETKFSALRKGEYRDCVKAHFYK
jgi:hypothetical protein